jgi:hypothetical protein
MVLSKPTEALSFKYPRSGVGISNRDGESADGSIEEEHDGTIY